jgi:hypothetical protein
MAAAGILLTPQFHAGKILHTVTGVWNLQYFLAHLCALGAVCAIVFNAVAKLTSDEELHPWFRRWIQYPVATGVLGMLTLFIVSRAADNDYQQFLYIRMPGMTLSAYWILYSALLGYLLYHGIRAFLDLRRDPPSRPVIDIYLVASGFAVINTTLRALTSVIWELQSRMMCNLMLTSAYLSVALFAVGAGYCWIRRVKYFTDRPGWSGLTTPHFLPSRIDDTANHHE